MKNFLIVLSIIVVTLLAVIDLKDRMAELDSMSKNNRVGSKLQGKNRYGIEALEHSFEIKYAKNNK